MKKRFLLLSFVILLFFSTQTHAQLAIKGFNALDNENFKRAETLFYNCLLDDPMSPVCNYGLAAVLANHNNISCDLFEAYDRTELAASYFPLVNQASLLPYIQWIDSAKISELHTLIDSVLTEFVFYENDELLTVKFLSECTSSRYYEQVQDLHQQLTLTTREEVNELEIPFSQAIPVVAVAGYGSEIENLSFAQLKDDYIHNRIHVHQAVKPLLDSIFQANNRFVIKDVKKFLPLAKYNILLTDLAHVNSQFKILTIDGVSFFDQPQQYPLRFSADSVWLAQNVTKFTLTGVSAISRGVGRSAEKYGRDFITEAIRDQFRRSDYVHISHEVSISNTVKYNDSKTLRLAGKEDDFAILLDLNANVVELTGNHLLDYGDQSFLNTLQWYVAHGVQAYGGGKNAAEAAKPLLLPLKNGKLLAVIGFNEVCCCGECIDSNEPGTNKYIASKAKTIIESLQKNDSVAFILATVHMAEHDGYDPVKNHIRITHELIDFGADMVMASQAHWVKPLEFYQQKPIYYGLGNFLFDQTHKEGLRQGFILHNYFYEGRLISSQPVFTYTSSQLRPELASEEKAQLIKSYIYRDKWLYSRK